jgi:L-erythrulose 1-phosphate isomerase
MSAAPGTRRTTWIGTSWKMNKTLAETRAYCRRLAAATFPSGVQPFVLPPLTALTAAREELPPDGPVLLGVQNAHWEDGGAWTGEVSMGMARDAGADLVEIGHSERREHFGETDATVGLKVAAALRHGLVPLVCVGESKGIRAGGRAEEFVVRQLDAALERVPEGRVADLLVAYEPVWAIGDAGTPATPGEVAPVMSALAARLAERTAGAGCRGLLYGGGVDLGNAAALLSLPSVDGLFVGRAAWSVEGLLGLVDLAAGSRAAVRA